MAAYLTAETSVSGVRPLLSSATTRRPSAPSPRTEMRSRPAPGAVGSPSNSKVTTLTAGPRMAGFDSTHSCRSARCSRPASSSEIIWAGIATDPATVNSISSAISQNRLGQTVVFPQVPKVTQNVNGTTKLVARRVFGDPGRGRAYRCVACVFGPSRHVDRWSRRAPSRRRADDACGSERRVRGNRNCRKLCGDPAARRPGAPTRPVLRRADARGPLRPARPAPPAARAARARRRGPGRAAAARRAGGR